MTVGNDAWALEVEDLTVAYADQPVLWDIDLKVPTGVKMAIIGPNGAGKSTLVKAAMGLIKPVAGEVPPAAPSKSARWQLRVVHKDRPECVLPLEDKPVTIGRGRENAIVARCDRVSREHARIRLDEHRPRVDDLGSRNGILVNGVKINNIKGMDTPLDDGDHIVLIPVTHGG